MPVEVKLDKERNCIVIELPMEKPRPSATGKTTVIATSHGLTSGEALYSGRRVRAVASAFVYSDQLPTTEKVEAGETAQATSDRKVNPQPQPGSRHRGKIDKRKFRKRLKS
jgi:hypothetical protein